MGVSMTDFEDESNNQNDLDIRRYKQKDCHQVWELHEQALRSVNAYTEEFSNRDTDLDAIPEVYLKEDGEFLVGELNGQVVAMGALQRESSTTAQVRRMRVNPIYQRRGFGSAILESLEQFAREHGYHKLTLDTTKRQTAAQNLYEKYGYEETRREKYDELDLEMIFYEKQL